MVRDFQNMWLKYGIDPEGILVEIEDVRSGKTSLLCPYCKTKLTAKKGRIKEHHFAHTEETCRQVAERDRHNVPTLPLYDDFSIHLLNKELEQLKTLWTEYGSKGETVARFLVPRKFVWLGLLKETCSYNSSDYEFTDLGKVPFGGLSLVRFNRVQEPLLLDKLSELEEKTKRARETNSLFLSERSIDLMLYRAQLKRILSNSLYFLKIQAAAETLYKIGVTRRSIEERATEVQRDLSSYFKTVEIEVLGVWPHRGNVEKYFKHRYRDFNHPIGSLTEYYRFNHAEESKIVLHDLRQMTPKILSPSEIDILANDTLN
jgi:hypothetical protein